MPYAYAVEASKNEFFYGTIVIDAGHGGIDGGVVGQQGVKESDINLKMSFLLKEALEQKNYKVVMTRTTEQALNNIKRLDMAMRKEIIQKADALAVISLHVNKFSDSSRRGVQVFYDDTGVGKEFAVTMQDYLNMQINAKYSGRSDYKAIAGDLYITKCAPIPSIIIECGFISNIEDEKLLLDDSFCRDLCDKISDVVVSSTID